MRSIFLMLLVVLVCPIESRSQQKDTLHLDVSQALATADSNDWKMRKQAFVQIVALSRFSKDDVPENDRLELGMINLLLRETSERRATVGRFSEDQTDYYADLVRAVANLDDVRVIPALVGAISSGGMATRALARFGEKALDPVLEQIANPDSEIRSSVLVALRDFMDSHKSLSAASRGRIKQTVRASLKDPDSQVRFVAVGVVEYLDQREEFVADLEHLAKGDAFTLPSAKGGTYFPIRVASQRVLNNIRKHAPVN